MPKMPDAEVLLHGTALLTTGRPKYVENQPVPGVTDGADVTILGPNGMAILRFSQSDVENQSLPQLGTAIAAVASGSSWAGDRGAANVVYRFVRYANANELDALHKVIKGGAAA